MLGPQKLDPLLRNAIKQLEKNAGYARFYPAMIKSTRIIIDSNIDEPLLAIGHLAYGWMPTILKNFGIAADKQKTLISEVRQARSLRHGQEVLNGLANETSKDLVLGPINRSWVGTSKVFHFINPGVFPIWDSKVARHFGKSSPAATNKLSAYLDYFAFAARHHSDEAVREFQRIHNEKWEYSVTSIRAMEQILFLSSQFDDDEKKATKVSAVSK